MKARESMGGERHTDRESSSGRISSWPEAACDHRRQAAMARFEEDVRRGLSLVIEEVRRLEAQLAALRHDVQALERTSRTGRVGCEQRFEELRRSLRGRA